MSSTAELIKQCKVKTASVKRLHKEFLYYEKERDREQARVDKMKADNADASDLKQAVSPARPFAGASPPISLTLLVLAGKRAARVCYDDSANTTAVGGSGGGAAVFRGASNFDRAGRAWKGLCSTPRC